MEKHKKLANAAMIALISSGIAISNNSLAQSQQPPTEKCYGIAKAHKNDCGTPKHSCAGEATKNGDPSEWLFVLKGNCGKIVGGNLNPPTTTDAQNKNNDS